MAYASWKKMFEVLPVRYVITLLIFWGFFNVFSTRVNLSISLVAMTGKNMEEDHVSTECPFMDGTNSSLEAQDVKKAPFDWDINAQGWLLSAYFIGFTATQLLGGLLSAKFGAKWIVGLGILGAGVIALVSPWAAYAGYWVFFVLRVLTGLASGLTLASGFYLMGRWSPENERAMLLCIVYMGTSVGCIVTQVSSGYLIAAFDWKMPFYVFGALSCLWFVFWVIFVTDTPETHPRISQKELDLLGQDFGSDYDKEGVTIPWIPILKSIPLWAYVTTNIAHNWCLDLFQTQLPTYFKNAIHLSIDKNGLYTSLPFVMKATVGIVSGLISTCVQTKFQPSTNLLRKIFTALSFYGAAAFMLGLARDCADWSNLLFPCLAMAMFGFHGSGVNCTSVDMSPRFSGIIMGISNTISNIAGAMCPIVTAHIIANGETLENWRTVYLIASCLYFGTCTLFLIFGSSNLQPWADGDKSKNTGDEESNQGHRRF